MEILSIENSDIFYVLCQSIMLRIYQILSNCGMEKDCVSTFNVDILNAMQTDLPTSFNHYFKTYLKNVHDDSIKSACFRVIIVNILKHAFIEEWLPEVITIYKSKFSSASAAVPNHNNSSPTLEVLNDNDVNRWFGWAVMKLKKKYNKLIKNGSMNSIYENKLQILEDMSVHICEVIDNTRYIRLYYPLDDAIRNRGQLTLLRPEYCDNFSFILKLIFKRIKKCWEKDETIIPDKSTIIRDMKDNDKSQECVYAQKLCDTYSNRLPKLTLSSDDKSMLTWDLISRVLNVVVGERVRSYRSKSLIRLNDVNFRKRISVKCEKKT